MISYLNVVILSIHWMLRSFHHPSRMTFCMVNIYGLQHILRVWSLLFSPVTTKCPANKNPHIPLAVQSTRAFGLGYRDEAFSERSQRPTVCCHIFRFWGLHPSLAFAVNAFSRKWFMDVDHPIIFQDFRCSQNLVGKNLNSKRLWIYKTINKKTEPK